LGHVLSDMEMANPRLFKGRIQPGFNWATSFQTWKFCRVERAVRFFDMVSIGPRPFRHGNPSANIPKVPESLRFNWATSFQTWKFRRSLRAALLNPMFQLGHVLSDMEIWKIREPATFSSNGFQLGHVLSDMEMMIMAEKFTTKRFSFNWATSFQTWK